MTDAIQAGAQLSKPDEDIEVAMLTGHAVGSVQKILPGRQGRSEPRRAAAYGEPAGDFVACTLDFARGIPGDMPRDPGKQAHLTGRR